VKPHVAERSVWQPLGTNDRVPVIHSNDPFMASSADIDGPAVTATKEGDHRDERAAHLTAHRRPEASRQANGDGATLMRDTWPAAYQTSRKLLCRTLRGELREVLESGAVSSVGCRAVAALYVLLLEHPIDRQGRCEACRRPGAVLGRRRRWCQVYRVALSTAPQD
jgi:hypothetical protein